MKSTEWKDQCAKCEGDAVSVRHINKSHVATLAQVQVSADKKRFAHRATPHKGLSPVQFNFCQLFELLDTLCVNQFIFTKKERGLTCVPLIAKLNKKS